MDERTYFIEQHRQMHKIWKRFKGHSLVEHIPHIDQLMEEHGCRTILDYGCGKAQYWPATWNVTGYDPAYEPYSQQPRQIWHGNLHRCNGTHTWERHGADTQRDISVFKEMGVSCYQHTYFWQTYARWQQLPCECEISAMVAGAVKSISGTHCDFHLTVKNFSKRNPW